ncbi:helix-turn-helix domain-containing protein [Nostoc sp. PA-18-2419]|uniref:helix-turn-helix domain-containing protein n=1 Tax=Nostoc sp. PA-18-2419 TaxID=2575443 RepID=UPI0011081D75|nr:helix-turn-helix domain-containing protein [Nostoc sp. PA-18-2419]
MEQSNQFNSENFSIQQNYLTSFQRKALQKILEQEDLSKKYRQRIQIMLLADEGKTQSQICQLLNCSRVTVRHWLLIAKSGEAHNWNSFPLGRPKIVSNQYQERLKELISHSPKDFGYPFRCWTAQWLSKHLAKELGIEVGVRHINRLLKDMGLSTRPTPVQANELKHNNSDNRLVINDLTETSEPNPGLWQFHLIN